ncbi:cyclase family protein [Leucobacter allii]|uniref:Cyclase family protein n=1 Tax=Leucobacter allii TaxID=2932247 RepID=A0ABY4FNB0_9MICO|nr:cyclase family protein [Leucobacter allii]UOQ57770.1 cyclase family protein [Leucobacter allii]
MPIVELSHPIRDGMPVYPGDPEVSISSALGVADDGVAVARLDLGSHTGTHLDAPAHSVSGGRTVDRIPVEMLLGRARVLRAAGAAGREPGPGERIGAERIVGGIPERLPGIVLVATGWDRRFGGPEALGHPHLAPELVALLWERGARVLGVDVFSPDPSAAGAENGGGMPVHAFWLGRDGVIVENLARLIELPEEVEVSLLPLHLAEGDGSPIRALAFVP